MKKDWRILSISLVFILLGVILVWRSNFLELYSIFFLLGVFFGFTGFLILGTFFVPKTKAHSWKQLRERKYFWIISLGDDFQDPAKTTGTAVLKIEGSGKTIMNLPSMGSCWPKMLPEVGKKYFKDGNKFVEIPND